MEVPKNHQLCMMYAENAAAANEFFEERGLTRCDVWTKEYPTIVKNSVKKVPQGLMLYPRQGHETYANSSYRAKGDENEKAMAKASKGKTPGSGSSTSISKAMNTTKGPAKAKKNAKKVKKA